MKPEEMRDDIPMDVREALIAVLKGQSLTEYEQSRDRLRDALRPKPRTVHLCEADLPAPLEEVPEDRVVWSIDALDLGGVRRVYGEAQYRAIALCLAFATQEDAEAWLAHLQSWRPHRPGGVDWTPHTPGDPMPCDEYSRVDYCIRRGNIISDKRAGSLDWSTRTFCDHRIAAWRYAREGEE
jgi:hypothetical protein